MSAGKTGGVVFALLFAVCFGAVGVFASWAVVETVMDGWSARDWVRVKAEVLRYGGDGLQYRYRIGDKEYTGTRLGVGFLESSEVDGEVDARLTAAVAEKKPLTVFVNPDQPAKSVVDPSIPWMMVLFLTPFALGFGGVGLGALIALVMIVRGKGEEKRPTMAAGPGAGALAIWVFAFFWNVISFPIALIAVPEMVNSGEWLGLLVLIFPFIGLILIWAALKSTWTAISMGGAQIQLQHAPLRLGDVAAGHVAFRRGVVAGDAFRVKLECLAEVESGSPLPVWKAEKELRVVQGAQGLRLTFGFDTPEKLPAAGKRDESTHWRLELYRPNEQAPAYAFAFEMLPRAGVEHLSEEEGALEDQELAAATPVPAEIQNLAKMFGAEHKLHAMDATERAQLQARMDTMTTQQREAIAKIGNYAHYLPLVKKLGFWAIGLFIAVQVVGVVAAVLFSS